MELIKAGADVNQASSLGATPLYIAAQKGHDGCVAVLIQAGADVRKADKYGNTPMKVATRYKREKVMTLLRDYERPRSSKWARMLAKLTRTVARLCKSPQL